MHHLLSPEGLAALTATLRQRPALVFDFDGTLAPIVPRPDAARISQAVAARLRALAAHLPVAVVSGRSLEDLRARLGFEPTVALGHHGAQDTLSADDAPPPAALDPVRERLREHAAELAGAGVAVEDKGLSIALHYRLSRERDRALATIDAVLADAGGVRSLPGRMAVELTPADAPDKVRAVHRAVARCGTRAALFAGDDPSDEPVFASAPAGWLTIRVGRDHPGSRANFVLDGPQDIALLLDRALAVLDARGRPTSAS